MPRAKSQASEVERLLDTPPGAFANEVVRDDAALLRTIGSLIKVRNQNGRRSNQFCLLCKEARRLRVQCPHTQIWELMK